MLATHTVYDGRIGCGDGDTDGGAWGISLCGNTASIEIDAFVDCSCTLNTGADCRHRRLDLYSLLFPTIRPMHNSTRQTSVHIMQMKNPNIIMSIMCIIDIFQ